MYLYSVLTVPAGILAALLIALLTKKAENVTYTGLDNASRFFNVLMAIVYACMAPMIILLGSLSEPAQTGIAGIIGRILGILIASAPLLCGVGLGLSVALRKKGKTKAGFAVQFIGAASIVLSIVLYAVFAGSLLQTLN